MTAFILMTAMSGRAAGGGGSCYPTTGVPSIFDACRTKLEAPNDKFVNTPPPQEGPLYLRMLCLSGDTSGSSDPYLDVRFGGQVFCSPPQTATLNPVWDYLVETEVKEPGVMRITIYDQDWGCQGDKLGDCEIQIPKTPMKIKKETIRLRHVLSPFLKKAPNSRINVLYHIVDRLDDQPDLLELSKQMGENGGEAASPQDYTVRVFILESGHLSVPEDSLSAIRVSLSDKSQLTGLGRPEGFRFAYGPRGAGSQLSFFLYNSTIEDLIQNRLKLEWILRKGNEDDLDAAKSLYLQRHTRDENSVPVTSVRVNIQDPIAEAVAEERKQVANLSHGTGNEDKKQEGQDGEVEGERLAQARHSSAAEVAAPTAEARDNSDLKTQNAKSKNKASKEKQTEAPFHGVPIDKEKTPQRSNNSKYEDELTLRRRVSFVRAGENNCCAWLHFYPQTRRRGAEHTRVNRRCVTKRRYFSVPPEWELVRQRGLAVRPPNLQKKKLEPSTLRARDSTAQAQEAAQENEAAPTTEEEKSKQRAHAPVRRPKDRDGTYYVYIYGDFFPKTDKNYNRCQWDNSDPFVVVSSPNCTDKTNSWSTTVKSNRQRECVWDPVPIRMPKNSRKQKLVLDVYDSDSPLLFGNSLLKEQVGSLRLLRANLGRTTWLHMYGGSFEGARGEFNSMMLKGGLDPPSTYHGSLCVLVDNKRMRRQDWPPFPDKVGLPVRIEVQLARGLYLPGMYRQREVSLLVQVAGCLLELPDDADTEKRKRVGFLGLQTTQRRTLTRDLEGLRSSRDMNDIPDANFDLLEFPGYVNSRGILRLYNWSKPRGEMEGRSVEAYQRAGAGDSGYAERNAARDSLTGGDPCPQHGSCPSRLENDIDYPESLLNAWVKRISEPVYLLPKVQWVYLYIVAVGEEDIPPRLFCRLPLQGSGRVKRFLEGTFRTSADDKSWPPPQALLKAKERGMTRASFDNDDVSPAVDAPAGRDPAGEPAPPHPAVLLSERGPGFLGRESSTFRDSGSLASQAKIPEKMKWAQIHWDQSVTPLPPSWFPSTFAGCLLGQARAIITDDPARFASLGEPSASSVPEPPIGPTLRESAQELVVCDDWELESVPRPEERAVMCGVDRITRRQGHVGSRIEFESLLAGFVSDSAWCRSVANKAVSPLYRRVYFHADMLQARNLPALDPDASVNPWWTIEVETEIVKFVPERRIDKELKILGSTANPSFLARTAVPVFLYMAPSLNSKALGPRSGQETAEASGARSRGDASVSLESSSTITDRSLAVPASPKRASMPCFVDLLLPPPPVVVRLFDIDVLESGDLEKKLISIVVDWDPANLDERQRTVGDHLRHQEATPPKLRQVSCEGGGDEREDRGKRLNASGGAHRDPREEREEDSQTDPNFDNEPVWYSLQDNQQLSFDVLERSVNLTNTWRAKPRLLASVGFSASACSPLADHLTSVAEQHWMAAFNGVKSEPGAWRVVESSRAVSPALASQPEWAVYKLSAPEAVNRGETIQLLYYEVDVDLLGIRVVEGGGLEPSDYVLKVSSFWPDDPDTPLEFLLSGEDFPGPNVVCQFTDQPLKQKLRRKTVSIPDSSRFRNSNQVVLPMRSAGITTVPGQWVGARISPPLFVTPYLPYLQALSPAKQRAQTQEQDAQRLSHEEDSALVHRHRTARDVRSVLPDINFRLIRRGGGDVASLSISLNEYLNFPQGETAIQLQILSPQLAKLPPPNVDRDIMVSKLLPKGNFWNRTHYVFSELPCTTAANVDVLIECFAEATGDLLYDDDLLVGRMLTDHDVFFIRDPDAEGIIIHTFNADDYFVGYHDKRNTPFKEPALKVENTQQFALFILHLTGSP
nr:hypothetical protein TgIa.0170 [Toxoplasma gondii RH]